MGFGPSSQLGFLADGIIGDDAAVLNTGSMSLSNWEPRLWVLLRLRICANFAETNVNIGPREGRHAGGHNEFSLSVYSVHTVQWNWTVCRVLTTDDRSVDLDICHEKRRVVGIAVNRFGKEKPQADSRHDRHTGSGFFISKERMVTPQSRQ